MPDKKCSICGAIEDDYNRLMRGSITIYNQGQLVETPEGYKDWWAKQKEYWFCDKCKKDFIKLIPERMLDRSAKKYEEDPIRSTENESICDRCERSIRGCCCWCEKTKPYPGWEAKSTMLSTGLNGRYKTESFEVYKCPGFIPTYELVGIIKPTDRKQHEELFWVRRSPVKREQIDDEGYIKLMEAAMKQARKDYIAPPEPQNNGKKKITDEERLSRKNGIRRSIIAWIHSLAGITDPNPVIRELKDEARICDLHSEKKRQVLYGEPDEPVQKSAKWIIYNRGTEYAFAECEACGCEQELTEKYPKKCPQCGRRMTGIIYAEDV